MQRSIPKLHSAGAMVVFAKFLGLFLKRGEDYYRVDPDD